MGFLNFLGNAFADGMEDTYDKIARKTDDPEIMLDAIEHKQYILIIGVLCFVFFKILL